MSVLNGQTVELWSGNLTAIRLLRMHAEYAHTHTHACVRTPAQLKHVFIIARN